MDTDSLTGRSARGAYYPVPEERERKKKRERERERGVRVDRKSVE